VLALAWIRYHLYETLDWRRQHSCGTVQAKPHVLIVCEGAGVADVLFLV
jgi:hypothetical protein